MGKSIDKKVNITDLLQPYLSSSEKKQSYYNVPANIIAKFSSLPGSLLEERRNDSPSLRDFIEIAKEEPRAKFSIHVFDIKKPSKKISIDGIAIPKEREDLVSLIKEKALRPPDIDVVEGDYHILWWG